jgi:large subunit ribosomal protein L25
MVNRTVIEAETRTETGKNVARRLRQSGHMPGVLYGAGQPTVPVSLNPRQMRTVLESETGRNTILTVEVKGGETTKAMLVDWQYEPVHSRLLHVDLKRIVLDQQLQATVPVVRLGEAPGVKLQGGILEFVAREVEVECLPADIPDSIHADVSELMIGTSVRVRDLKVDEKVRVLSDPELVVVHVVAPRQVEEKPAEEAAVPEEAAPAEPEVIRKGKGEEEEEEATEAKKK